MTDIFFCTKYKLIFRVNGGTQEDGNPSVNKCMQVSIAVPVACGMPFNFTGIETNPGFARENILARLPDLPACSASRLQLTAAYLHS